MARRFEGNKQARHGASIQPGILSETALAWILGTIFFMGLALAGSEGDWFPWINIVGGLLLVIAGAAAEHFFRKDRFRSRPAPWRHVTGNGFSSSRPDPGWSWIRPDIQTGMKRRP